MALLIMTNPSSTNYVKVSSDRGDRVNRYTLFTVSPAVNFALDEADVMAFVDQEIPDSLRSGILTIYEPDLDSLSRSVVQNFIASGLDIHYYTSTGILKTNRIVTVNSATGKMAYVTTLGDAPTGSLRSDSTNLQYMRVRTAGTITVELGGTVASGDYLISDTTGRAVTSTTKGLNSFALASASGSLNGTQSVTIKNQVIP